MKLLVAGLLVCCLVALAQSNPVPEEDKLEAEVPKVEVANTETSDSDATRDKRSTVVYSGVPAVAGYPYGYYPYGYGYGYGYPYYGWPYTSSSSVVTYTYGR